LNPGKERKFWNHRNTKILIHNQLWFLDAMLKCCEKEKDYIWYEKVKEELTENTEKIYTTTIVSGFVNLYKFETNYENKKLKEYLENGKILIDIPIPKIIFIDKEFVEILPKNKWTTYIPFSFEDVWLYSNYQKIKNIENKMINQKKDINTYLMIGLQKSDWMKKAIDFNIYQSQQYMWIDFGIFHIMKNNVNHFQSSLINKCNELINPNIIYSPICKKEITSVEYFNSTYLNYPIFYFAGGLFIGSEKAIKKFDELVKTKTLELINKNLLTFEVNVWYMIYTKNHQFFSVKSADHNISMLS
jgi:hypothetical protein